MLWHDMHKLLKMMVVALFLLSGCAAKPSSVVAQNSAGDFSASKACANNAFLQKYGCSLDRIESAAEQNDADAEYALGYMYFYGLATVRDQQTAMLWINRAASQGQPLAIKAIGILRKKEYPKMGGLNIGKGDKSSQRSILQKHPLLNSGPKTHAASVTRQVKPPKQPKIVSAGQEALHKAAPVNNKTSVPRLSSLGSSQKKLLGSSQTKGLLTTADILTSLKHHYTLQLMASHHLHTILHFMAVSGLKKGLGYYRTRFHNRAWYVVIYGDFKNIYSARDALKNMPAFVRQQHPWVKSYDRVQRDILTHNAVS